MPLRAIREFIKLESSGGILLLIAAIIAILADNTFLHGFYQHILEAHINIGIGKYGLNKTFLHWVNDGLMTIFFFLVGLEIKREVYVGELNTLDKAILPCIGAIGGMVAPAAIYVFINWNHPVGLQGWAIPTATDIAFSLCILSLLGSRVSPSLKVFLTALAIIDDLLAILIIAFFYTANLSMLALSLGIICVVLLFILNRMKVDIILPYLIIGFVLWLCVLKSGVHATLAGVLLAFAIPLRSNRRPGVSPSQKLEHKLHPWVVYLVLPVFAFANAGVSFAGFKLADIFSPIPLGIAAGLFIGKQVGIFVASWLSVKFRMARLPAGTTWTGLYGTAMLCGIGFTMSLFIGSLAFDETQSQYFAYVRMGVLLGSFLSGVIGYLVLRMMPKQN